MSASLAYGMKKLISAIEVSKDEILFIGDKPMLEVCEKMKMKPVLRKLLFKEIKSFKFKELMEQARNRKPSDDDGDLED
jgi:hypothetical protein